MHSSLIAQPEQLLMYEDASELTRVHLAKLGQALTPLCPLEQMLYALSPTAVTTCNVCKPHLSFL